MKAFSCALGNDIQDFEEWSWIYKNMNQFTAEILSPNKVRQNIFTFQRSFHV
jgi:hypothetical protein